MCMPLRCSHTLTHSLSMVTLFLCATVLLNLRVKECRFRDEHTRLLYVLSQFALAIEAGILVMGNLDYSPSAWYASLLTYMSVSLYAGLIVAMAFSFMRKRHHRSRQPCPFCLACGWLSMLRVLLATPSIRIIFTILTQIDHVRRAHYLPYPGRGRCVFCVGHGYAPAMGLWFSRDRRG
jgi:uncharacterized membrane protein SirB2